MSFLRFSFTCDVSFAFASSSDASLKALSKSVLATDLLCAAGWCELKSRYLCRMCWFTVHIHNKFAFVSSFGMNVQEGKSRLVFPLYCELNMWIDRIQMSMECLYRMFLETAMTIIHVPHPPLKGDINSTVFQSMYSMTKSANNSLTGEPIGHPNTCW